MHALRRSMVGVLVRILYGDVGGISPLLDGVFFSCLRHALVEVEAHILQRIGDRSLPRLLLG